MQKLRPAREQMSLVQRPEPERTPRVHRRLQPLIWQRVRRMVRADQLPVPTIFIVKVEPSRPQHDVVGPDGYSIVRGRPAFREILGHDVKQLLDD